MEATRIFIEKIARNCQLDEQRSEELCDCLFKRVARRLGNSAGIQFVFQLPYGFQQKLMQQSLGPDRSITAQKIVSDVADILVVPPEGARQYIQEVWDLLNQFADRSQLRNSLQHLPADIAELFELPQSPEKHDFQQWLSF